MNWQIRFSFLIAVVLFSASSFAGVNCRHAFAPFVAQLANAVASQMGRPAVLEAPVPAPVNFTEETIVWVVNLQPKVGDTQRPIFEIELPTNDQCVPEAIKIKVAELGKLFYRPAIDTEHVGQLKKLCEMNFDVVASLYASHFSQGKTLENILSKDVRGSGVVTIQGALSNGRQKLGVTGAMLPTSGSTCFLRDLSVASR